MKQYLRFFHATTIAFLLYFPGRLMAQPEQDCFNAIPVCQNIYQQNNSYVGEGTDPNEINSAFSCLGSGEQNDVWYIFTVQTSGLLNFTISPLNFADDYDWAVYNLTGANCADISTNPALEVSCNYSADQGPTGPNTPGNPSSQTAFGNAFNAPIPVTAGETYVINVSNFTGSASGYTLNFTASTAAIFDNIQPVVDTVTLDCNGNINVMFSENIVCSSVDLTDFTLTGPGGPYTITSAIGANCTIGGAFENEFQISVTPALSSSGKYAFSLIDDVFDNCGNVGVYGTDSIDIVFPVVDPIASIDTLCQGGSTTLSVTPQAGMSYTWSGGLTGPTVNVTPNSSTTYTCFATDANGCLTTVGVYVHVWPIPTSTFSATPAAICPDQAVTLNFTGTADPTATYSWDVGNGQITSGSGVGPVSVEWNTPGLQNINLTVNQNGCTSNISTQAITVNPIPTADFTAPLDVCVNSPALSTYTGTASSAANFFWDFDGGIPISGAGAGPYQVEWATPGPRTITLTVEENGCTSPTNTMGIIVNAFPVVSIDPVSDQCLKDNTFNFNLSSPATGSAYSWDFGDASPLATTANPSHSYSIPGPRTVRLTFTDDNGCSSTATTSFEVFPLVTADFNYVPVCFGTPTPFTDLSVASSTSPIQSWDWNFANQGTSTNQTPQFDFPAYGNHDVQLIVTSIHACKDTISKNVEVYDQPIAAFEMESACDGVPISFTNTSSFNNPNVSYLWNFGSATSTDENPDHLFSSGGTYKISMTISTNQGCTDTYAGEAEVYHLPVADFEIPDYCLKDAAKLASSSTVGGNSSITQVKWDFGPDYFVSNRVNPSIPFDQAGEYPIELWVSSNHGCLDSITKSFTVKALPEARFSVKSVCESAPAIFENLSTIDSVFNDQISSWTWDFGDQIGSDQMNPQHIYPSEGTYQVTLTAIASNGCQWSVSRDLEIYPDPDVPTVYPDTACFSDRALLITEPAPFTDRVEWFFNQTDTQPFQDGFSYITPPLPYKQTYYLEAVNNFGCRSGRIPIEAHVFETVAGGITVTDSVLHIPNAALGAWLTGDINAVSYHWDFGDGTISNETKAAHQYQRPGKYVIELQLSSQKGCEYNLQKVVEVKELIVVHIPSAFSPNGDGINDEFHLGSQLVEQVDFQVFNRWGQKVFLASQPDFKWDGRTLKGKWAEEGVYTYILKGIDINGKEFTKSGTLTLFK